MAEETYRNPLFGRRVDRYIPPELRQGIGALLAGADMLNPVSAYREYLKDVREGDVVGGVTNAAGFVAPGVASAVASRLARPAMSAVAPYGEDAARVLMEVLSPTGAPEVSRGPMDMSRREFLGGLGAVGTAAATAKLPVDEMLEGLGRAGARGGGRLGAGLSGLRSLRDSIRSVSDLKSPDESMVYTLSREIDDLRGGYFDNELVPREVTERISSLESELSALSDKLSGPRAQSQDLIGNYSSARDDLFGDVVANTDDFISEIGDLSDDDLSELGSQLAEYVANPSNVSRLKSGGYEPSEIVSSFGRIGSALREEAVRRDLGGNVLDDVEYLLSDGLPEVAYSYRLEGSRPAYSADFNSMLPDVTSRMVSGGDEFRRGLGSFDFPSPEVSQRTQIAGTLPTYRKALEVFDEVAPEGESLDYGAGLGKSSELGFDTFEPYAREGFEPTYRSASEIPDASYERVTNLNVLNVVGPEARRGIVLDIGRILKPDGVAIITTRGRDVLNAKGSPGPEDMSIVTSTGTYQKGFTRAELVDYLRGTLGDGFEVNPLQLGPAGATVRKLAVRPD